MVDEFDDEKDAAAMGVLLLGLELKVLVEFDVDEAGKKREPVCWELVGLRGRLVSVEAVACEMMDGQDEMRSDKKR